MGNYINPIPYLEEAKEFEMRLHVSLDEVTEVEKAKEIVAEYILSQSKEDLIKALSAKTFSVYSKKSPSAEEKRLKELLNTVADYAAIGRGINETVKDLLSMGFTKEELISELNFDKDIVEHVVED